MNEEDYDRLYEDEKEEQATWIYTEVHAKEYLALLDEVNNVWDRKPVNTNWLGLEQFIRKVLNSHINDYQQVYLINEAIGAFTRRGRAFPIYANGQVQQ